MTRGMPSWCLLLRALLLVCALSGLCAQRAWAMTAAGTSIANFMTVNYQDPSANNYSTISNTVTTLVANVASMTITASAGQNVTIGMIAVDTFTLTNTGNGSGNFQIPTDATFAGTAGGTALNGYVLSSGPCAIVTPCALSTLETQMAALAGSGVNATLSVGVEYTVSGNVSNVSVGETVQTTLTANILYPLAGSVAQAISSNATSTPSDTVVSDARLDLQATATTPSSSGANITWAVAANNGGGFAANDASSINAWVGASGIFITAVMPTFAGPTLALQSAPTCVLNGATSGATATVYYYTGSSWSTTVPSPLSLTVWVACLIHGGAGGTEFPSAPTGSNGAGNVTTPQATLTYVTAQPSGGGSANLNAVTSIANACLDGQAWVTGSKPALCPTIALGTADSGSLSLTAQEANTTPSVGTIAPGGASNTAASQAYIATAGGTTAYVGSDTTTQGNWHAASTPWTPYAYGSDGYGIIGGTTANPAYATVTLGGTYTAAAQFTASPGADARAPYTSATSATRVAYHDYGTVGAPFTINVNISSGTHQFCLYLMEWDASAVQDAILVTDVTHGTNLLFHAFTGFNNGSNPMYVCWNITGNVTFTLYSPDTNADAATISAYFFDPVIKSAVTSTNSGSYVMTDVMTQGNWSPGSGGDGYLMPGHASAPSYQSSSAWFGGNTNTWAASTLDLRGMDTTPVSGLLYAAQYAGQNFGISYTLSGGAAHTVAMYFLDWDTTARAQTVYVADPTTGALFDARTMSGFHNGTYAVWSITGGALFYVVRTGGINATFSGIYFGQRVPYDTLVNAVSPIGNQAPGTNLAYTTTFLNGGAAASLTNYIANQVPANTYFKVSSATASLAGTGLTAAITYSNNGGGSYAYTPVSGGGGAPAGYDRNVSNVRWTFTGTLYQGPGLNTGSVAMTVMIQ